jgi:hypothetical protein
MGYLREPYIDVSRHALKDRAVVRAAVVGQQSFNNAIVNKGLTI